MHVPLDFGAGLGSIRGQHYYDRLGQLSQLPREKHQEDEKLLTDLPP